jgi:hypothetical protein
VARQAATETEEPHQNTIPELTEDAFDLNEKPGSPMVQCILNSEKNAKSTVDTGSVITIVKRDLLPGPPAPPSKLRLKDVNKGTSVLYGPRVVTFNFGPVTVKYPVYEAFIEDDCLIGSDFMDYFDCTPSVKQKTFTIRRVGPNHILTKPVQVPCSMVHSPNAGRFSAGRVYYEVRAGKVIHLAPLADASFQTMLQTDSEFPDRNVLFEETTDVGDLHCSKTNVHKEQTKCGEQVPSLESMFEGNNMTNVEILKLGLITKPATPDDNPNPSRLHPDVLTLSGVIPCATAPIEITLLNTSDNLIKIPKYAVVAEVFLLNPMDYDMAIIEQEIENLSLENDEEMPDEEVVMVSEAQASDQQNELQQHNSKFSFEPDINTKPKLPEIPATEPLPEDLQDLINRCSNLTPTQQKRLEQSLRKNHDIFAKDNTTFGCCPWVKFQIDTGDHAPIKQQARPIPLHYRKAVYETFMKYLECGAVRPSHSLWASPILCVPKKTGEIRVCIDYRALNHITKVPAIPIPLTQELIQKLAGHKVYHTFDLAHGYHNLEIDEKDIPKTAVILPEDLGLPSRHLEWTRLSFGLSAAPGIFQHVTDRLMRKSPNPTPEDDVGPNSAVYLDPTQKIDVY